MVDAVPAPVPPVYRQLKDLRLTTTLVARGEPRVTVVAPASGIYDSVALRIQSAMERITGVTVAIASDDSAAGAVPIQGNLILLGNRSTNAAVGRLYDLFYCLLDLKYPGPGGYNVRTLHSPFGDGRNVIFVGASDTAGMQKAAAALLARLDQAGGGPGELSVGHLMDIELSEEPRADGMKHWDDGRQGAYGWNVVSEHMAMYYMTGRETHARAVLRYAFADASTREELREKEFIDYHDSPLAQGWDYNSHLMVLLWDLIEESPAFSAEERLRVTNALARQLVRLRNEGVYDRPLDAKVTGNDMHASYSALGLHTLGRYFEKDYPDPIWRHCLRAAHGYYTSFHEDARFAEGTDNLEWSNTTIQPVLTYLILTGWREPLETGALQRLLRAQEALLSGLTHDSALDWASLALFNKAAYLTQDGRWAVYRDRTGLDTGVFRLGQSFWPEERLHPAPPLDLVGQWNVYEMPDAHRRARDTGFAPGQAFYFGSFRSAADATGDFILIDGYNGEARNPYHAFSVNELRIDGHTVLQGYRNQVLTSADGVVEPAPAMDAALEHASMTGDVAVVVAEVPRGSWASCRRVLAQRVGRYALLADEVTFRASSENMAVETLWETPSVRWRADEADWSQLDTPRARPPVARDTWHAEDDYLEIATGDAGAHVFEVRMSDVLEYRRDPVARMGWHGRASRGDRQTRFSLIARRAGADRPLACVRVAPNAAALALPESALAVAGSHDVTSGKLAVVAESHLFGHDLVSAGILEPIVSASRPVDVAWDFTTGALEIAADGPTDITVTTDTSRTLQLDGRPISVEPVPGGSRFRLPAGRHRMTGARLTRHRLGTLATSLRRILERGKTARARSKQAELSRARAPLDGRSLRPVFNTSVGGPVADLEVVPSNGGSVVHVAAGKTVSRLAPVGTALAPFTADADVRALHWWPEQRLLLAGTVDDKVIAFDQAGTRRWTFELQMDPGFYGPGDDGPFTWLKYWPALTGVHGLYTATFLDGETQAFVGSTNTLTILDEHGTLVKRFPVLRGMVHKFTSFPAERGRTTLLLARQPSDWDTLTVIDSVALTPQPEGFHDLPPGHKVTWAWMQNRPVYLTSTDLDRDGALEVVAAIDGVWNRVSTWRTDGTPRCSINFPPGESPLYRNLPGVDVGDLNGDGKQEIVVATAGRVLVALGHDCVRLWSQRLRATPTTLTIVPASADGGPAIVVGDENGSVLIFDGAGRLVQHGRVDGRPTHTALLPRDDRAPMVIIGTDKGRLAAFVP